MSARSFVYTTDQAGQAPPSGIGLSEHAYDVHPLYLLLVAPEMRVIRSAFADEDPAVAYVGSFAAGRQAVLHFLGLLLAYDASYQTPDFERFIVESERLLRAREASQVVLETFELSEAEEPSYIASIQADSAIYLAEVAALHAKHLAGTLTAADLYATTIYPAFSDAGTYFGQAVDWEDFWSDTLYYSLDEED